MARNATSKTKAVSNRPASRTLVLDVGAHSIKAGYATDQAPNATTECYVIPNCIARSTRDKRTYVGSQLDDCQDFGELAFRRPVEKGYIVNWEGEKAIWESSILYDKERQLACDPAETNLILTEAPQAPAALQRHADEMVFEEFGFASYGRVLGEFDMPGILHFLTHPGPILPSYVYTSGDQPAECLFVIDAGHSHTTLTPLLSGRPLHSACRRLDIGGKTLTNQLKDLVSTRQFELQKEFFLVEQMKEDVCYVAKSSEAFADSLERCWKGGWKDPRKLDTSIVVEYVLPDYEAIKRGYVREHDPSMSRRKRLGLDGVQREDFVVLGNERFAVPELLFTPSDLGMQSPGIAGMVLDSLEILPKGMWQAFLANIVVVGATSKLPGFVERLEADLQEAVDERLLIKIRHADDPVKCIWEGGARIASSEALMKQFCVSKTEYAEHGDAWCRRVFAGRTTR